MSDSPSVEDQRGAARFDSALTVELDGTGGHICNVSDTGVYFETDLRHDVGEQVNFTVEFNLYGKRHRLRCEGNVVRVDAQGDRMGVAAHFREPFFSETETVELSNGTTVSQTGSS